jgi:hypothetical protein
MTARLSDRTASTSLASLLTVLARSRAAGVVQHALAALSLADDLLRHHDDVAVLQGDGAARHRTRDFSAEIAVRPDHRQAGQP